MSTRLETELKRNDGIKTKNNMTTSDNCVSNSPTTTGPICTSSSLSSSSTSSSQIVDDRSPLERQTTRRTTIFFVEDIMQPDFGMRHVPWRSDNNVRLDVGLGVGVCLLSTDMEQSSSPSSAPPTNSSSRPTTSTSTVTRTTATPRNVSKSLNDVKVEMLPAWIFCTRYSDRPSSGIDTVVSCIGAFIHSFIHSFVFV